MEITIVVLVISLISLLLNIFLIVLFLNKKREVKDYTDEFSNLNNNLREVSFLNEKVLRDADLNLERVIKDSLEHHKELKQDINKRYDDFAKLNEDFKTTLVSYSDSLTVKHTALEKNHNDFFEKLLKASETNKNNLALTLEERITKEFTNSSSNLDKLFKSHNDLLNQIDKTLKDKSDTLIKNTNDKLSEIEGVVNRKITEALEENIKQKFTDLKTDLSNVTAKLGELKNVSADISQVRNLLTNVKTRGVAGEIQLQNIIQDILPDQLFVRECLMSSNSKERVDFAIRLLDSAGKDVLLPIDSKFVTTDYNNYLELKESSNKEEMIKAKKKFLTVVKNKAKEITKYINPPYTTPYCLMFLPSDSLYYEVLTEQETLEECRKLRVEIVGPSTIIPMLNAIHLGFTSYKISQEAYKLYNLVDELNANYEDFFKLVENALSSSNKTTKYLTDLQTKKAYQLKTSIENVIKNNESYLIESKKKDL